MTLECQMAVLSMEEMWGAGRDNCGFYTYLGSNVFSLGQNQFLFMSATLKYGIHFIFMLFIES